MIDIEWAKNNCSINLEKIARIKEDEEWLENEIDRHISVTCQQGKRRCVISTHITNRGFAEDEAVAHILKKYSDNGYIVVLHDNRDVNIIDISW